MPTVIAAALNFNLLKIHFIFCGMVSSYLQNVVHCRTTVMKTATLLSYYCL